MKLVKDTNIEQEIKKISDKDAEEAFKTILTWIGEDPNREGLLETPKRVMKAFKEYFKGYKEDPNQILDKTFGDVEGYDDGDIKSLRWAFKFDLPIFLVQNLTKDGKITTKKGAPFRKIDLIKFIDDCPYDNHLVFTSSEGGKDAYFLQEDIPKSCFQQRALKVSTNKKKKRSQAAFRAAVIKRFEFCKCVLCDAPKEVIEAAHIIPVEDNGSDWDQNGILLCKNHHSLFDKGLWAIDPDYFEIIPFKNNDLSKMQIHRSNIRHLEVKPAQKALIWRWNDFQKRLNPDKN